ncbi:hypothetical protein [Nocardia niwae]|uniref:hypothetical protein n=1 Tax=Nocardia niwae TaxID=626084 RepID=UPI0012F50B4D|nr:hypothetical protein [Nocardia niwae]
MTVEFHVEPQTPNGNRYASLVIDDHGRRIAVALDQNEMRTLIGDAVQAWFETGQPDDRWQPQKP